MDGVSGDADELLGWVGVIQKPFQNLMMMMSGKVQYQFSVEGSALNISFIKASGILYNSSCLNSV